MPDRCGWLLPCMSPVLVPKLLRSFPAVRPPHAAATLPLQVLRSLPSPSPLNAPPGRDPTPQPRQEVCAAAFRSAAGAQRPWQRKLAWVVASPPSPRTSRGAVEAATDIRR